MKNLLLALLILFFSSTGNSQENAKVIINILENDDITEVNLENQAQFIDSLKRLIDNFESSTVEFKHEQKIGLLITVHKTGEPSFKLFSHPELPAKKQKEILQNIDKIKLPNTKILDFPFFISLHCDEKFGIEDFPEFIPPREKRLAIYQQASLKEKVKLNREMAINEALPVLTAYQFKVDEKFKGVRKFAKTVKAINYNEKQYVELMTGRNTDYWRACLEMAPGNQLIPASMIFLFVSQDELDIASHYIRIVHPFSDEKTIVHRYLEEIKWRLEQFNEQLKNELLYARNLENNISLNEAIAAYDKIIAAYPNSAEARYERYFLTDVNRKTNDFTPKNDSLWKVTKNFILEHDPLFNYEIKAQNPKEAYQKFLRASIDKIITSDYQLNEQFYNVSIMSLDLDFNAFSAQLFCLKIILDQGKTQQQKDINYFLYNLEKLVVQDIKQNFKGDFEKIFTEIELEREKTMKESNAYKDFR